MEDFEIIDSNDFLKLKCYKTCTNDSLESEKKMRGIIYDTEEKEIVPSFGYTDLYTVDDKEMIKEIINPISDWKFYSSIEGTLLRCFYYQNKWYLSTHRKLDAFQSRWSCKYTFGELFVKELRSSVKEKDVPDDILEWFYSKLNKESIYYFLLRSNIENRIVCQCSNKILSQIIYIGSLPIYETISSKVFIDPVITEYTQFEIQKPIEFMNGIDDLIQQVNDTNFNEYQGILGWNMNTNKQIKIFQKEYECLYKLRANNPNLRFRFLELRNDSNQLRALYNLYPKYSETFDDYEDAIRQIARILHQYYINRYIKNQYITLPKEEYIIVKKAHEWYLQDKKNNNVFSQNILDLLNKETPLSLYKMIKRYFIQKKINK